MVFVTSFEVLVHQEDLDNVEKDKKILMFSFIFKKEVYNVYLEKSDEILAVTKIVEELEDNDC